MILWHIFFKHVTNIVVESDCGTSLDKQDMKGEDRGVLRSPSCSQAISPKMPFSNIQSLLPGKHVEIGLMINWNECHARFHVFQSMLLEFFPGWSNDHILYHHFHPFPNSIFVAYTSSQILGDRKVMEGHIIFAISQLHHFRSFKVAKRLGRSLESNQPLPKGVDADPECMAYVTWRTWDEVIYWKSGPEKVGTKKVGTLVWRTGMFQNIIWN